MRPQKERDEIGFLLPFKQTRVRIQASFKNMVLQIKAYKETFALGCNDLLCKKHRHSIAWVAFITDTQINPRRELSLFSTANVTY